MKILALGSSEFGGDWHPLGGVLATLHGRGHEIKVAADQVLSEWINQAGMPVEVILHNPTLMEFSSSQPGGPAKISEAELFQSWGRSLLQSTLRMVQGDPPDVLLCSLAKLPLAVLLHRARGIPLCTVNPGLPFRGVGSGQFERDYPHPEFRELVRLWKSLEGAADLVLHATSRILDASPNPHPPDHHFLGPVFWERPGTLPEYVEADGQPWVLLALSTTAVHREIPYIRMALEALEPLPVRVLATVAVPDLLAGADLPSNAFLEAYVPHTKILKRCHLAVSHGGHGSAIKSLYFGVPMVLLPRSADQFAVSARVYDLDAAEVLDRQQAGADSLTAALKGVLGDRQYSSAARDIALGLQKEDHLEVGCRLIEGLVAA